MTSQHFENGIVFHLYRPTPPASPKVPRLVRPGPGRAPASASPSWRHPVGRPNQAACSRVRLRRAAPAPTHHRAPPRHRDDFLVTALRRDREDSCGIAMRVDSLARIRSMRTRSRTISELRSNTARCNA